MTNQPEKEWYMEPPYWEETQIGETETEVPMLAKVVAEATRRGKVEGLEEAMDLLKTTKTPVVEPSGSNDNVVVQLAVDFTNVLSKIEKQINSRIQQYGKEE